MEEEVPTINRVSIKVPPFYRSNPNAWFRVLEAQFDIAGITTQKTRLNHLISNLPEDIGALLLFEEATENYDTLKNNVLDLVAKTKQERINEILDTTDIGCDKPSIFLRKLRSKMQQCDITCTEDELTQRLLRCLPKDVATPLRAFQDLSPQRLAQVADTMMAHQSINAVSKLPPLHSGGSSKTNVSQSHVNHSSYRPSRQLTPFHPNQRPQVCRAHIFYGQAARTCRPWCKFPKRGTETILRNGDRTPAQQSRSNSPTRSENE